MADGAIDQLHFEVILDDAKFKKSVGDAITQANKLNTQLNSMLDLTKKFKPGGVEVISEKTVQTSKRAESLLQNIALRLGEVIRNTERMGQANEKAVRPLEKTPMSLQRLWLRFTATVYSVISAIRLFTRTIGKAIKNISDFQQANANLATIMQVSKREIETLTNDALMLGRTTEWTASQVTELQTALAKLGYNIPQIRNMQASVLQFATAVGAKLPEAANLAGASLRMFGMHSTEMQKALEILTASTNKTALDFEKLKVSLPYVGAIAHSLGMDIAQTASLLGVLTNAGLESSRAGTGLRQVLLELAKQGGKLQTAMGGNIKTFDDFVRGLEEMRDRGLDAGEATKLVSTRAASALLILANGVDDIKRLNNEVRDTDGLLKNIQAERLDTLHGSTLLLKSAWEGLIQTFRDSAGPMKDIVNTLTNIIRATSLAASRANRVAQGTDGGFWGWLGRPGLFNKGIVGSDTLTKQFQQQYMSLLTSDTSPEEAAKMVNESMQKWLNGARDELIHQQHKGYSESWFKNALYSFLPTRFLVSGKMNAGREANEQVEAIENAMDAVNAYIANHSKETAEIAANNYLEQWRLVFDTQGADAARAAMNSVAGYEDIKNQVERYIASGGLAGINDRATVKGSNKADKEAEKRRKEEEKRLREEAKAAEKAQQALEKYQNTYRRWSSEDFDLGGTGFEYDIRKVLSDLNTNLGKVDEKYLKAVEEAMAAHRGNAEAIAEETEKLEALRDAEKTYEKAQAQNRLDKLAESYLKDQYLLRGINMDNLGTMSISQLRNLKTEMEGIGKDALMLMTEMSGIEGYLASIGLDIENLTDEDLDTLNDKLPETTIQTIRLWKALKDTGLSFDTLNEKIQTAVKKGLKNLDEEEEKAILKLGKYVAKQVLELADAFRELGEATGNGSLEFAADSFSKMADVAKNTIEGFKQGGAWGAVIGAVFSMGKIIVSNIAESQRESARIAESLRDAAIAYEQAADAMAVASKANVFGVNSMGQYREYVKIAEKYKKVYTDFYNKIKSWGEIGEWVASMYTKENGEIDAERLNYDISNGLLTDGLMTGFNVKEVGEAVKQYLDALKEMESFAESIVGNVSESITDKIVDSWWEAGQAALDYADILGDVAKAYAKLIVNDMLLEAAFDPGRQDAFKEALRNGDTARAMSIVEGAMQSAVDMLPAINSALQVLEPYRNMTGSEGGSNSVGSGIKSITEETASLLASYINAIRSDVSYIRVMYERGLEHMNAFGASLPTLNDHIAQIAATNFDIAQSNQSILSELRSVIGPVGTSGMVVRVEAS